MKDKWRGFAHGRAIALAAVVLCCAVPTAHAEVHIEGDVAAVRVTATHDTLADVLAAFAATFNVKYRSAVNLAVTADGTYTGSLRQVIAHLLDGYNYVVKSAGDTIEIIVLDPRGTAPIASSSPPTQAKGLVARWR
jgi:hypothetical protein